MNVKNGDSNDDTWHLVHKMRACLLSYQIHNTIIEEADLATLEIRTILEAIEYPTRWEKQSPKANKR